jgi:hypothetical protein
MMGKFIVLVGLLLVLTGTLNVSVALPQRVMGVEVGDWAEYIVANTGNQSRDPHSRCEWAGIDVEAVSGRNVTYTFMRRMADGSWNNWTYTLDVETGRGLDAYNQFPAFIASNLDEGDILYTSISYPLNHLVDAAVNETVNRSYLGVTTEVNHLNVSLNGHYDFYWFKASGLLAAGKHYKESIVYGDTTTLTWYLESFEVTATSVDITPPNIEILSPENQTYSRSRLSLILAVDDAPTWIGYSLDGEANVTITGNWTLPDLSEGPHSIIVYAKNIVGNTGISEVVHFSVEESQSGPFSPEIMVMIAAVVTIAAVVGVYYFVKKRKKRPSTP